MKNYNDDIFGYEQRSITCYYLALFLKHIEYFRMNKSSGNCRLLYRGQSNANLPICPSVFRKNNLQKEAQIVKELKRVAPQDFSMCSSQIECLIKMQHYGLPTRLLDVTLNPLVALYFACSDEDSLDKDGAVYTFSEYVHSHDEILIERNASLSTYSGSSPEDMSRHIEYEPGFLNPDKTTNKDLIKRLFGEKYHAVMPPLNNERIRRQQGAFLLFGLDLENQINPCQKESFTIDNLRNNSEDNYYNGKIIVIREYKKPILKDLDALGINKAFLFPELEHQASYIRETILDLDNQSEESDDEQ